MVAIKGSVQFVQRWRSCSFRFCRFTVEESEGGKGDRGLLGRWDQENRRRGSMRKSTWIVFLPLFLFLFFDIDSLFCLHSDIRNSELSKFPSILNTVMASKTVLRGRKRLLRQCDVDSCDSQENIQQIYTAQDSAAGANESDHLCVLGNQYRPVNSKRWRTLSYQQTGETSDSFCRNDNQSFGTAVGEDMLVRAASNIHNTVAEEST
ncbi:uncharacterized protein LOC112170848 [Rosa chinensis]|uniref:uncharacterized protein LOC112170848 n=1 Tax=Rosa chinensis TaxID=74649 RepID=UPI001AD8D778|nr:uncharacterized protein LOC112170848 [Rosa chinensis]